MARPPSSPTKPSILIVDDDQFMRKSFQDILKKAGFATALTGDGTSAVVAYQRQQPDLILLDLVMPGMDGFATCQEIRGLPGGKFTPVLMITSMEDTGTIHRAFEAGATDFITKPINPELLVHRIRYMLRASRSMKKLAESETRLANAQRIAQLGNWEWDPLTGTFSGSEEMFRILGMAKRPAGFSRDNFLFAVYPPDRELVDDSLTRACTRRSGCDFECRVKLPDATLRTVRLLGQAEASTNGKIPRIVGTLQDVTEIRQAEERMRLLKEAVDCLPIGITITDPHGKIIYSNPAEAEMHGYTIDELLGGEARLLAPENLRQEFTPDKLKTIGLWRRESVNLRKTGEEFPVQLSSIAVKNSEGRCLGIVTACEDISGRKETEQRIQHLAYYDTLTGLPNRGTFLDRLNRALALAHREGRRVGLLFLDLDNFKDVNDTRGHDFGDKLLQEVAGRLAGSMRESDTLARLGGDEFVVVLTSVTGQESAAAAAQRVLSIFSRPFSVNGSRIYSSASIGVALYPEDGPDADSLYKAADTAMYHAKAEGKANYRFFSGEMNQKIVRRVELENSLRRSLANREFFLHYQPIWDVQTARLVGVEALLRWQSPDFGLLPPAEFIALAENSGLIFPLGEWVLRTACTQARKWGEAGLEELKMAVNISGAQFRQPDFLETVGRIIGETGVEPGRIELEFTESVIMEHADKTVATLGALKEMGVRLIVDDFGTGYSSLSYLKHFPIDRIKIDRSFVADVTSNNDDAAIVEAIISLAHSLKLKVVAEGVETGDQLAFLAARDCDEVQGFFLAVPETAEQLADGFLDPRRCAVASHPAFERLDLQLTPAETVRKITVNYPAAD